jgi:NAD(P)-dependent dehydrogenase (short-subunit alcohol dehydrogenase family)
MSDSSIPWDTIIPVIAGAAIIGIGTLAKRKQDSLRLPYKCAPGAMAGKTVIVTGANTGISSYGHEHPRDNCMLVGLGKQTALTIAQAGGHVVMACRNMEKGGAAHRDICQQLKKQQGCAMAGVTLLHLDLSNLANVRQFVSDLKLEEKPPLVGLVNNAGAMCPNLSYNADCVEQSFATNYLGMHIILQTSYEGLKNCLSFMYIS